MYAFMYALLTTVFDTWPWLFIDYIDYDLGSLHRADIDSMSYFSELRVVSIFMLEVN
jgi:hypothetical protein